LCRTEDAGNNRRRGIDHTLTTPHHLEIAQACLNGYRPSTCQFVFRGRAFESNQATAGSQQWNRPPHQPIKGGNRSSRHDIRRDPISATGSVLSSGPQHKNPPQKTKLLHCFDKEGGSP
jgi:hypothetical protein